MQNNKKEAQAQLLVWVSLIIPIVIEGAKGMNIIPSFIYFFLFWGGIVFLVWAVMNYVQTVNNPLSTLDRSANSTNKKRLWADRMRNYLDAFPAQLEKLSSIAIDYPLDNYEKDYLMKITEYPSFKKQYTDSVEAILVGIGSFFKVNPKLVDLEKIDDLTDKKLRLDEIRKLCGRISPNTRDAILKYIRLREDWESNRIYHRLFFKANRTADLTSIQKHSEIEQFTEDTFIKYRGQINDLLEEWIKTERP